jgi:hypothetical protein
MSLTLTLTLHTPHYTTNFPQKATTPLLPSLVQYMWLQVLKAFGREESTNIKSFDAYSTYVRTDQSCESQRKYKTADADTV